MFHRTGYWKNSTKKSKPKEENKAGYHESDSIIMVSNKKYTIATPKIESYTFKFNV